jgi:hypothetical protein
MRSIGIALAFLALLASSPVVATEIYHWVDENGVSNFSSTAPPGLAEEVSKMTLEDTTPPDYDPEEDRYGVAAQAERMASLREEMAEKREERRDRESKPVQQQPVQYSDPYRYGNFGFWQPPYYTRPPVTPELPIVDPYLPRVPFRPPGLNRN